MSDELVARLRAAGCVFAEEEAELIRAAAGDSASRLEVLVAQRVEGLPLEQVVGWAELGGLRVGVEPGVFVPRRRTELLVAEAVRRAPSAGPVLVVDLCCGVGAIGLAVRAALAPREVELHASDVEPAAVRVARANVGSLGTVHEGDLYAPLPAGLRGRVDLLTANVPYVPTAEVEFLPREARLHEPRVTLDGGEDGLAVFRRVVAEAPRWLAPGGAVLSEVSGRQVDAALAALGAAGLEPDIATDEDLGATVAVGTL